MSTRDFRLRIFTDPAALAGGAAAEVERRASARLAHERRFSLVLAGGSTPRAMYELLASEYRDRLPWSGMHLFWGDERTVPPNHEDSNFGMAWKSMISKLRIPPGNVHRMRGELEPERAASEYERELRSYFELTPAEIPRFDLVLLGMGEDGHTASLFPGNPALDERKRLVVDPWVEQMGAWRLTLTCPVLNNAACIIFLVSGGKKAGMLRAVLEQREGAPSYPAQAIQPRDGELLWYVDRAAAGELSGGTGEEAD